MKCIILPIKKTLILATCIGLTACFHDEPDVTPNQAFSNAVTQLSNVSNKTNVIITDQTDNSTAYESLGGASAAFTLLNGFFGDNFDDSLIGSSMSDEVETNGEMNNSSSSFMFLKPSNNSNTNTMRHKLLDIIKQHTSTIDKSNVRQKISSRFNHTVESNTNDMDDEFFNQQAIDEFLIELFNTPTKNGNTYTYTLRKDICDNGDTECLRAVGSFTMEITLYTNESGLIDFKVSNITATSFEYSPTLLSLEVFLEGIKALASLEGDGTNDGSIPEIFSGSFKLSIELVSNTEVKIIASIPQAININGDMDGDPIEFTLASTSKLLAITADSTQNTATFELGFGMLYAKFMGNDGINPSTQEISLKALTALLTLDGDTDTLTATNIGIGDEPFTLSINDTNAVKLEIDTFGFDLAGSPEEITLTSDLNLNYYVLNVNGELGENTFALASDSSTNTALTGELSIMAPNGTVLVNVENDDFFSYTDVTKIISGGPVTMTGSGYFASDFTASSGQCIESTDDVNTFADGTTITDCQ